MNEHWGKLIVVDGPDRAGKATAVAETKRLLQTQGLRVVTLAFPRYGHNFFADMTADFKNGKFGDPVTMNPYLASLPYIMDRVVSKPEIFKMLEENDVVLFDRYNSSNDLLQGAKCETAEELQKFLSWNQRVEFDEFGLPRPDLVIILKTPPTFSQNLVRGEKDAHEKNLDYQTRTYNLMQKLAALRNWPVVVTTNESGFRPKEEIAHEIIGLIKKTSPRTSSTANVNSSKYPVY